MHCNREEVVSIAIPDRRFSDTLAVYLLPRLVLTRTLRLLENRLWVRGGLTIQDRSLVRFVSFHICIYFMVQCTDFPNKFDY